MKLKPEMSAGEMRKTPVEELRMSEEVMLKSSPELQLETEERQKTPAEVTRETLL